jgi:hypothetical protein
MNVMLIIGTSLVGLGFFSQYKTNKMVSDTETPKYVTIKSFEKFEIRKYPKMILATTKLGTGGYSYNSSKGFRNVASYIFGGNDENKQISMTSPVLASIDDTMSMSFIMPSEYVLSDLPNPENENVKLLNQPERIMATISFGGFANDQDIKYYTKLLKEQLVMEGLDPDGNVFFQGYDPPFKLFNRTNEVAIELKSYE